MRFYDRHVLAHLIRLSMRQTHLEPYRRRIAGAAAGRVLEIGIGSGANLPFYGSNAREVIGLDPSASLLSMAQDARRHSRIVTELVEGSADAVPLDDGSIDTVVTTWALCSIDDVPAALAEMRRLLKSDGRLLFVEHGRSPESNVARWQDRLTPLWRVIAGGCHLNRPIRGFLEESGFRVEQMSTGYMKGPKPMTFMYEGAARPR